MNARDFFQKGIVAYNEKDWNTAEKCFQLVKAKDVNYQAAQAVLEKIKQIKKSIYYYSIGIKTFEVGDFYTAIEYLNRVIEEDKNYADAQNKLNFAKRNEVKPLIESAKAKLMKNDFVGAESDIKVALNIASNLPELIQLSTEIVREKANLENRLQIETKNKLAIYLKDKYGKKITKAAWYDYIQDLSIGVGNVITVKTSLKPGTLGKKQAQLMAKAFVLNTVIRTKSVIILDKNSKTLAVLTGT